MFDEQLEELCQSIPFECWRVDVMLWGSDRYDTILNNDILKAVQIFIVNTKRFA